MENRPVDNQNTRPRNPGRERIKNITRDVEARKFDPETDSILPKKDWHEHMAQARTSSARMKAASLKSNGTAASNRREDREDNEAGRYSGHTSQADEGAKAQRLPEYRRRSTADDRPGGQRPQDNRYGSERPQDDRPGVQRLQEDRPGTERPRDNRPGIERPQDSRPGTERPQDYRQTKGSGRQRIQTRRPTTASQLSREFDEEDRKREAGKRRGRKPVSMTAKVLAVVFVIAVILGSVFLITSYGAGTQSNKKGNRYYMNGDYQTAVTMYEKALDHDSRNSEYYTNLGMAYIALMQYDDALKAFDNAVKNTGREALLQKAKRGSGIVYLYQGHYTKAQELFNEALSYGGGTYADTEIDILYYLAEAQDRAGDAVGAVLSYSQIIEHQADANAYMLRGLAYQRVGDNTKAEADLEAAIQMSKKNYKTYLALYEVLMAQGKEDDAKQTLQEAISLGGKTGEDYSNLGIVYMYMQDYTKAEQAFHTALEKGYNGAYLGLAESLLRQQDQAGAAAQYERFLAVDTSNATAYNQYGLCLMALGRHEEAAAAFASGLALNDRLVDRQLMYNEAVVYERMADWTTAYEKMKAYVQKYPDDEAGQHELTFLESRQQTAPAV